MKKFKKGIELILSLATLSTVLVGCGNSSDIKIVGIAKHLQEKQ